MTPDPPLPPAPPEETAPAAQNAAPAELCDLAPPSPLQPPPPREPFWGYADVLLFAGLAIPCMFFGWALVQAILRVFHLHVAIHAAELLAEQSAGYVLLFSALRMIFRVQYQRPFWRSLGWNKLGAPFLWLVIAGCATAVGVAFATYLVRVPTTSNPMTELMHDRASIVLLAIFGVTVGPLCEELVFRGLLQPLLVRSLGTVAGILAAAVPFGLLHIPEYGNSWRHGMRDRVGGRGLRVGAPPHRVHQGRHSDARIL